MKQDIAYRHLSAPIESTCAFLRLCTKPDCTLLNGCTQSNCTEYTLQELRYKSLSLSQLGKQSPLLAPLYLLYCQTGSVCCHCYMYATLSQICTAHSPPPPPHYYSENVAFSKTNLSLAVTRVVRAFRTLTCDSANSICSRLYIHSQYVQHPQIPPLLYHCPPTCILRVLRHLQHDAMVPAPSFHFPHSLS